MANKDPAIRKQKQREYDQRRAAKRAADYQENRETRLASQRIYRMNNPDKVKATAKKCYEKGKDKKRQYAIENQETISARMQVYGKEYRRTNADKIAENARRRKEESPLVHLTLNIRSLVYGSFRRKGWKKSTRTQEILNCDFNTLQNHLILSAIKNYGCYIEGEQYHIDHIVPVATARSEEDVIRLNHYTNLQLLTPEDNMKKGSKTNWALNKK